MLKNTGAMMYKTLTTNYEDNAIIYRDIEMCEIAAALSHTVGSGCKNKASSHQTMIGGASMCPFQHHGDWTMMAPQKRSRR